MSDTVTWADEPEVATAIRQRRWVSLAMMILVFGSGTVIGSGLTMIAVKDKYDAGFKNPPRSCDHVLPVMQRELHLSDEQSGQVRTILNDHDKAMGKMWLDMRPKVREQLKHLEDQVNGVLTAEQQATWHAWLEQRRRRFWGSASHGGRRHDYGKKPPQAGFGPGKDREPANAETRDEASKSTVTSPATTDGAKASE